MDETSSTIVHVERGEVLIIGELRIAVTLAESSGRSTIISRRRVIDADCSLTLGHLLA